MKSDFRFRLWLSLLILLLCILSDARCASRQLTVAASVAVAENERALSIAAALPNGPDRDAILRALKNSNKAIKEQSAARIEAEETASENKADAKKWRWLTWGAIGAGLIFLGLKLRPRL